MTRSAIWHPFTQHAIMPAMRPIRRGAGQYLYDADDAKIFDAISSWWVTTHGHNHPRIVAAIKTQADALDQVIFAGHTHEPAEAVAAGLLARTPDDLGYVFFSDSGSTAVEVALKMALGYWAHVGAGRSRIIVMADSYHGDTIGAMAVGQRGVFNQPYAPLLFDVDQIPFPEAGAEQTTIDALEALCARGDVAAFIVEPLVLGAGGMRMYGAQTLGEMRAVCARHDVLFIADEVMTGWGRTGRFLACEHAGVTPDILCLSKGVTGGSLPLAVTLCADRIYDAHYSTDRSKTFFHSSSYTANPIACAAAAENLAIWEDEPVLDRIQAVEGWQAANLAKLSAHPKFHNARQWGTIAAIDLKVADQGYLSGVGPKLYAQFQADGLLIRPLGDTIYLMPPYCSTQDDVSGAWDAVMRAADAL